MRLIMIEFGSWRKEKERVRETHTDRHIKRQRQSTDR